MLTPQIQFQRFPVACRFLADHLEADSRYHGRPQSWSTGFTTDSACSAPFADDLDKFQREAMLECDHQFMGSREFCLACGQWNSDEHLDTAKHARRLMWFQEGKLHKQIS